MHIFACVLRITHSPRFAHISSLFSDGSLDLCILFALWISLRCSRLMDHIWIVVASALPHRCLLRFCVYHSRFVLDHVHASRFIDFLLAVLCLDHVCVYRTAFSRCGSPGSHKRSFGSFTARLCGLVSFSALDLGLSCALVLRSFSRIWITRLWFTVCHVLAVLHLFTGCTLSRSRSFCRSRFASRTRSHGSLQTLLFFLLFCTDHSRLDLHSRLTALVQFISRGSPLSRSLVFAFCARTRCTPHLLDPHTLHTPHAFIFGSAAVCTVCAFFGSLALHAGSSGSLHSRFLVYTSGWFICARSRFLILQDLCGWIIAFSSRLRFSFTGCTRTHHTHYLVLRWFCVARTRDLSLAFHRTHVGFCLDRSPLVLVVLVCARSAHSFSALVHCIYAPPRLQDPGSPVWITRFARRFTTHGSALFAVPGCSFLMHVLRLPHRFAFSHTSLTSHTRTRVSLTWISFGSAPRTLFACTGSHSHGSPGSRFSFLSDRSFARFGSRGSLICGSHALITGSLTFACLTRSWLHLAPAFCTPHAPHVCTHALAPRSFILLFLYWILVHSSLTQFAVLSGS